MDHQSVMKVSNTFKQLPQKALYMRQLVFDLAVNDPMQIVVDKLEHKIDRSLILVLFVRFTE